MKKLFFLFAMIVVSCSDKPQETELSQTEKAVIEYARQHVGEMVHGKTFTIEGIDTLLTDDLPVLKAEEQSIEANEALADVYATWKRSEYGLDEIRMKPQYDGYWRLAYKVGIGNGIMRVLMDSMGIVPVMTEKEFFDKMNALKCNKDVSGTGQNYRF